MSEELKTPNVIFDKERDIEIDYFLLKDLLKFHTVNNEFNIFNSIMKSEVEISKLENIDDDLKDSIRVYFSRNLGVKFSADKLDDMDIPNFNIPFFVNN
jgi:hypothetical protein